MTFAGHGKDLTMESRSYWLEDDESGISIGSDGVGADFGAGRLLEVPPEVPLDDALAEGGGDRDRGGFIPLIQPFEQVLALVLQVCMHVIQPCVWLVAL
jgi:hypothetical protein